MNDSLHEQPENDVSDSASGKKEWKAPSLSSFPTQKSEGKDFFNFDEGFITSGPS